jgi:hypothetical protein
MWQLILLKDLQIVQFIKSANASLQLDWNGVLKCMVMYTTLEFTLLCWYTYISNHRTS